MKYQHILVTGGKGYLGGYIVPRLKDQGAEVFVTSRKGDLANNCRRMDLLDSETIKGVCHGMDAVIHLANLDERLVKTQPREALLANSYATRELYLDAVREGVKKFIYFSTFHVYGQSFGNIDETTFPRPQADYGLTHYFAEQYLEQLSLQLEVPVAAIRLTNGIGAPINVEKWYLVLNDFCRTAFHTGEIVLKSNGLPQRDFVSIRDVVSAVEILLQTDQKKYYEVYNVSNEKTYSIRDLAMAVADCYEGRYEKKVALKIPLVSQREIDEVKELKVFSQKIRRLGWLPQVSLDDVINDIFIALESADSK